MVVSAVEKKLTIKNHKGKHRNGYNPYAWGIPENEEILFYVSDEERISLLYSEMLEETGPNGDRIQMIIICRVRICDFASR